MSENTQAGERPMCSNHVSTLASMKSEQYAVYLDQKTDMKSLAAHCGR